VAQMVGRNPCLLSEVPPVGSVGRSVDGECWGIQNRAHCSQNHKTDAARRHQFEKVNSEAPKVNQYSFIFHFIVFARYLSLPESLHTERTG
jgi:hypothetical protein